MGDRTVDEIAKQFGLAIKTTDPGLVISAVATLGDAKPGQLSFCANSKYRSLLAHTQASAVVLAAADAPLFSGCALVSNNPYADFARIAQLFERKVISPAGIDPTAVVHASAKIHPSAHVGALCVVGENARIGPDCIIHPHCFIGEDCDLSAGCTLMARVTLVKRVVLGQGVIIHSGAVLGADGFGFAPDRGNWVKVPQLGGVRIGDRCEIGANTTIDCGALGDTVLGNDVKLDNQIQIGHNVQIGSYTAIAGCTAVAGSTKIGARCLIAGAVGIAGHLEICDGVSIMAMALVSHSIHEKGSYAGAMPLMELKQWRRNAVHLRRLDGTLRASTLNQVNDND